MNTSGGLGIMKILGLTGRSSFGARESTAPAWGASPAEAKKHRGTRRGYGYEGTLPSVVPLMIERDVVHEPGYGDARRARR
jgi:hypothetical protein